MCLRAYFFWLLQGSQLFFKVSQPNRPKKLNMTKTSNNKCPQMLDTFFSK